MSGRLIDPKTLDSVGTVLGGCVMIYAVNYVLVCMRPELAMDFHFTKWN